MRKDRVLDMLDNAEDKIVDRLSVPALTEKEKERLLKMSKDKLDIMNENNSIFVITPPVAALLTSKVLEKKCVLFENEGMEAMFELKVDRIPGIVAIKDGKRI